MKNLKDFIYEAQINITFDAPKIVNAICDVIFKNIDRLKVTKLKSLKERNYNAELICDELDNEKFKKEYKIEKIHPTEFYNVGHRMPKYERLKWGDISIQKDEAEYNINILVGEKTFGSIPEATLDYFIFNTGYYILVNKSTGDIISISNKLLLKKLDELSILNTSEINYGFIDGEQLERLKLGK